MTDTDEDLEWLDDLENLDSYLLTEVIVNKLPQCDTCFAYKRLVGIPAAYDGKTKKGPWAYMCQECFEIYGVGLGLGKGHRFVRWNSEE